MSDWAQAINFSAGKVLLDGNGKRLLHGAFGSGATNTATGCFCQYDNCETFCPPRTGSPVNVSVTFSGITLNTIPAIDIFTQTASINGTFCFHRLVISGTTYCDLEPNTSPGEGSNPQLHIPAGSITCPLCSGVNVGPYDVDWVITIGPPSLIGKGVTVDLVRVSDGVTIAHIFSGFGANTTPACPTACDPWVFSNSGTFTSPNGGTASFDWRSGC